jgi:glutathione synthase/RimK-type ligase-like ATP-grasp enzyme
VKLILANNQSDKFREFFASLQAQSDVSFAYSSYETLLFMFDSFATTRVRVSDTQLGKNLDEFDGVYINGYLSTYELATTVATCCDALGIGYANDELHDAPSLSKLSMYAKLAAADVTIPKTFAGAKTAILQAEAEMQAAQLAFPLVLKRADADRGIDNYKVSNFAEIEKLLEEHEARSIWILQEYVDNDGYYLLSYYDSKPAFSIFRSLEARPDGNEQKAHMYKPKGGTNATLVPLDEVPTEVTKQCSRAIEVAHRQIGSVDCIFDQTQNRAYVLEVNYNPQLVTIETFKDVRIKAFLDYLPKLGTDA